MKIRQALLYWIVLGFSFGIVLEELVEISQKIFFVVIVISLIFIGLALLFRKKPFILLVFVILISMGTGFSRNHIYAIFSARPTPLDSFAGQKISFQGVITEEQQRRDFDTRLVVRILKINNQEISSNLEVLVTTANPKDFLYGDLIRVRGDLVLPENFYTDTGREFDYIGYLTSANIRFLVRNASVMVTGHDPPSKILARLFFVKRAFVTSLSNMLPEPQSSLAAGILIDGKQSINAELQEKFQKTGIVHIVVLSGSNVSIVAEAMSRIFIFLPRMVGLLSASVGIIAFTLVTGSTSTVVRASIMALLVIFSRMTIRNYDPGRGLFIATILMLLHNPSILTHSPSFQLSFLATFMVIKIVPRVEKLKFTQFLPERFGLRELVVSNITVQLFLFPILSWMTGFVSAVSLPVNLLVVPLVPMTMLVSFLTGLSGLMSTFLAWPFAFVANTLLSYELHVVDFFSKMSLADIPFGGFSGWVVAGFYAMVIVCVVIFDMRKTKG